MSDGREREALYEELVQTRIELTGVVEELIAATTLIRLLSDKVGISEYIEAVSQTRYTRSMWESDSRRQKSGSEYLKARYRAKHGLGP